MPGRLNLLAGIYLVVVGVAWILVNAVEGELLGEFQDPGQWLPQVTGILISGAVIVAHLLHRLRGKYLPAIAIAFQSSIAYCIAVGTYWNAFRGVSVTELSGDRIGVSGVGVFMFACATLIPARPRNSALGLLGAASATPVVYWFMAKAGSAPMPAPFAFFAVFVLPYLIVAGVSWFAARIVFALAQDVRRARALGSYRLEARIGSGGMGEVWRATHAMLARPAAIKLIKPEALSGDQEKVQSAIARFEREARITASLESPNTVKLYDFGQRDDGTLYYAMELLDGIDLQQLIDTFGKLPPERAIHFLVQSCNSLSEAHRRGLVHRDIKPANLFVCCWAFEHDFLKVVDFGLARVTRRDELGRDAAATHADTVIGTPAYIAPETVLGQVQPDERADVYALGCVAFLLLTGKPVFHASTVVEVIAAHVGIAPSAPSEFAGPLPKGLDEIVLGCLQKKPEERTKSVDALREQLTRLELAGAWTPERAASWWAEHESQISGINA